MKTTDVTGKKILFVAGFYPPSKTTEVPGAMRTIKLVRNLVNAESHVLTVVDPGDGGSALDHLQLPVNSEKIHRVESFDIFKILLKLREGLKSLLRGGRKPGDQNNVQSKKQVFEPVVSEVKSSPGLFQRAKDFIYNLVYFPDQFGPWVLPAYFAGKKLVKRNDIDVVFATGSPWSGLLVGYMVARKTGVPFIADFRDPWINNPFHLSKGAILDKASATLERRIVRAASAICLNTDFLMEEFRARYPELPEDRFLVMPNGYDPDDFKGIEKTDAQASADWLTLCHAGFLYGVRDPAMLLDAIRLANKKLSGSGRKMRFRQIGEIELSYDLREKYADLIEEGALQIDPPMQYKSCLGELSQAGWVVNVQPATRSQVPSKLYDYLALDRPIIHITAKDGALGRMVAKHNLGELFEFEDHQRVLEFLLSLGGSSEQQAPSFTGYEAREKFDCRNITADFAELIRGLT